MELFNSSSPSLADTTPDENESYEEESHNIYGKMFLARMVCAGSLSLVGVVANVINIVVFYRQGILTESSTATLAALALSDFFVCLLSLWCSVALVLDVYWDQSSRNSTYLGMLDLYIALALRPKSLFTQITCWCTAYLAMERCCSVVFPFKVKTVFPAKRSCVILSCIFVGTICLFIPKCFENLPVWEREDNVSELVFRPIVGFPDWMYTVHLYMNIILLRTLAMAVVIFCNVTIFRKVNLSQKFKKSAITTSASEQTPSMSTATHHDDTETTTTTTTDRKTAAGKQKDYKNTKEMALLRMLMVICSLFIICYTPDAVVNAIDATVKLPEYVALLFDAITNILEVINSGSNILIYYNMNTRFRRELRSLLFNTE